METLTKQILNKNTVQKNHYPLRIVQFGEGNFLRAFVDWIVDRMNKTIGFNTSIAIVQPIEKGMTSLLNQQDGLYTTYLKGIKEGKAVKEYFLIDSIHHAINPYQDFSDFLALAENPTWRFMISNTTESGIAFDAQDTIDATPPKNFPAKATLLAYHRFQHFHGSPEKGLIFLPCELINYNGKQLKECILKYADLWELEGEFKNWIEIHNIFCNTLVDRIVTGFPQSEIAEIHEELGYEDHLVVEGEQFHLWVIEAPAQVRQEFPADKAGLNVIFTDDMQPYRTRKVRILNGAHTAMTMIGLLAGLETVKETIEDEKVGKFIKEAIFEEIAPTLELPQNELESFANDVIDRFRNPFIRHNLASIALNSFSKFETRVLPTILDFYEQRGFFPPRLMTAFASLLLFYKGEYQGKILPVNDEEEIVKSMKEVWEKHDKAMISIEGVVKTAFAFEKVWKQDLNNLTTLKEEVVKKINEILS